MQETPKSVFTTRYESLKLSQDANYLMISEDTVEDPLVSVQFDMKSKSFSFRITVYLLFPFSLHKMLIFVFLPRYESSKLKHDTNYLMTSDDVVEDRLMSVQFYIKSKRFLIPCYSPKTVLFFIEKDA